MTFIWCWVELVWGQVVSFALIQIILAMIFQECIVWKIGRLSHKKSDFLFGFSSKSTFARYLTQRCFCCLHLWIYAWFSELDRKKWSMKALYLEKMQFVGIILSEHYHWRIKESRSESSTLAALAVWVSIPGESWYPEEAEPGSRIAVIQWDCSVSRRKQSLLSVTASNQSRVLQYPVD